MKTLQATRRRLLMALGSVAPTLMAFHYAGAQDKSGFPDGYDAVQAAPGSHKVLFENSVVRVLEVSMPPAGKTEPMHHHRWPSFFLSWDMGGKTPHIRYLRPDGSVREQTGANEPVHPGKWTIVWMKPEPMHAIQTMEKSDSASTEPSLLRIEIKCA